MRKYLYKVLRRAARKYIARHNPYIVGITWSVGKTTCRMIATQTIESMVPSLRVSTSPENFNTEIGLCLSILGIESWNQSLAVFITLKALWRGVFRGDSYDVLVAEYGLDAPNDIEYLLTIATPHIGIFTTAGLVHAQWLWGPDEIIEEKSKMLVASKEIAFVSTWSKNYLKDYLKGFDKDLLAYALYENDANESDIWFRNWMLEVDVEWVPRSRFTIEQGKESIVTVDTNLLSMIDAWYVSLGVELAMIVGQRLGKEVINAPESINYTMKPWRFWVFAGQYGSTIVDSSYNWSPKSMAHAIQTTVKLRNDLYPWHNLIYCLWDMRELWTHEEKEHRQLASLVAQSADKIYLLGPAMHTYMWDELDKVWYNPDDVTYATSSLAIGDALLHDIPLLEKRSVILFKASQNTLYMEEAVKPVLKESSEKSSLVRQSWSWLRKKTKYFSTVAMAFAMIFITWCSSSSQWIVESQPRVCFEQSCYEVEIADSPQERATGLMWRESMPMDAWMLFVFENEWIRNFWMKNTLIPLDMIRLDSEWVIVHIEENVQPCEMDEWEICPSYGPDDGVYAQYVLELNGGEVEKKSIAWGSVTFSY